MFQANIGVAIRSLAYVHHTVDLPLGEMYRYGFGCKYKKSDDILLGAGLSFLWEGDLETKRAGSPSAGYVSGEYENVSITFLSGYIQW